MPKYLISTKITIIKPFMVAHNLGLSYVERSGNVKGNLFFFLKRVGERKLYFKTEFFYRNDNDSLRLSLSSS